MAYVPSAPTLTAPASGGYTDLSAAGGPFSWVYNNTDGSSQASYQFRRKLSAAGAYEYWNATTSVFQATAVDNTATALTLTFPATAWVDGNTYQWSVATTSSLSLPGPFASDVTVYASAPPVATVTGPVGTQSTQQPPVAWTVAVQSGLSQTQTAYRVIVEGGAYGASPGSGTLMYDSGTLGGGARQLGLPVSLPFGASYRAFVQLTVTGGQVSAYASSTFTITTSPLAQIVLTAVWDPLGQRTVLTVQGHDNLLSVDGASFETATGGWSAQSNVASFVRSTAQAVNGAASLAVTAAAAAAPVAINSLPVPVTGGLTYTALVSCRAAATPQNVTVAILWINTGSTVVGTTTGAAVLDTTTGWVQATVTGPAPYGAVTAQIQVAWSTASAASEVHYLDAVSIAPGTLTAWSRGGAVGQVGAIVERSADSGATWAAIRASGTIIPAASQFLTLYDLEPPLNVSVQYSTRNAPHALLWDIDNWDDTNAVWT